MPIDGVIARASQRPRRVAVWDGALARRPDKRREDASPPGTWIDAQVAEIAQQNPPGIKGIPPSVLLALAMALPIVAFCLLVWLAGRARGAADAVAPADFANWQSGTSS